jgi:membrane associated rhomboid family serine protease
MWYDPEPRNMRRYPSSYASSFAFGPGPLSSALKAIIGANVAVFLAQWLFDPTLTRLLGLNPQLVTHGWIWQLATYMFLHGGLFHILFNMLALWMFGTELERKWGTRYFVKFYFVTGIGAGILTVMLSWLPFEFTAPLYRSYVIGASGAIYGILLAYALYFPERQIILIIFPVPAKYAVMIIGAIAFYSSFSDAGRGVSNFTHLGGLLVAYLFLTGARVHPLAELKYRYLKWKINRVRKKFDVYSGGRADDWDRHVH